MHQKTDTQASLNFYKLLNIFHTFKYPKISGKFVAITSS